MSEFIRHYDRLTILSHHVRQLLDDWPELLDDRGEVCGSDLIGYMSTWAEGVWDILEEMDK